MAWASQRKNEDEGDKNYYHNLCNYSIEKCEFCDMVFSSRFANIIHNSSHIIIPLLKQKIHRCKKCLFCFTSKADLRVHKENKHDKKKLDTTKVENSINNDTSGNTDKESLKPITIKLKGDSPKKLKVELPQISAISINNFDSLIPTDEKATKKSTKKSKNSPKKTKKELVQEIVENTILNKPLVQINDDLLFKGMFRNKTLIGSKPNKTITTYINNGNPDSANGISDTSILPDLPSNGKQIPNFTSERNSIKREISPISIKSDFSDIPDFFNDTPELRNILTNSTLNGELKILSDDEEDNSKQKPVNGKKNHNNLLPPVKKAKKSDVSLTSPVKLSNLRSKIQFEDDVDLSLLDKELKDLSYVFQSVHHDELVKPNLSECNRCHMIFYNRMDLYIHEKIHMRFRPLSRNQYYHCYICKKHFAGNHWSRKKHFNTYHPESEFKKQHSLCKICNANLEFEDKKMHYKKLHPKFYCETCNRTFSYLANVASHSCQKVTGDTKVTEVIKVCELCFSFTRNKQNFKYEVVGEKSEIGKRQKCFYCNKEYFEVKLVKRSNLTNTKFRGYLKKDNTDPNTNEARLAKLQKRLKAIKVSNKF